MTTEAYSGSETIGTTEWSLTTDTAGPDAQTTAGVYQAFIDLSALAAGDTFRLTVYEKTLSSSTQRVVWVMSFSGAQPQPVWPSPSLLLMHGFDFTIFKVSGTDRAIDWSIRKG